MFCDQVQYLTFLCSILYCTISRLVAVRLDQFRHCLKLHASLFELY